MECVRLCVSRGINLEQSQVTVRGNQGMRNRPAKLSKQLISPLIAHMEKVKINAQRTPKSGWLRFLVKEILTAFIYPGELIFNLTEQAGSLGLACPAPFR
jgi:hypothetical protein